MKVITAAAAIDAGFVSPGTVYSTSRDDSRYYRLPGDGSHHWEPTMTVRDAIVHSSNIVRINSLIPGEKDYYAGSRRMLKARRIIGTADQGKGVVSVRNIGLTE